MKPFALATGAGPLPHAELIVCQECDTVYRRRALAGGDLLRHCVRRHSSGDNVSRVWLDLDHGVFGVKPGDRAHKRFRR